jgi:hypothetical protein
MFHEHAAILHMGKEGTSYFTTSFVWSMVKFPTRTVQK